LATELKRVEEKSVYVCTTRMGIIIVLVKKVFVVALLYSTLINNTRFMMYECSYGDRL
jgi:hypothetical protein